MGIFGRLASLIKSNLNDLISKSEDPEKMLNQVILEMNVQLQEAKKQVALAIADEKRLGKQFETERATAEEWERKAMMAVRGGEDDLAKEALMRQKEHESLSAELERQWHKQKTAVDQLKNALRVLNSKIEEAKRKKNVQMEAEADAQSEVSEQYSGDALQQRFRDLETNKGAEMALEDLKRKMGLSPGAAQTAAPTQVRIAETSTTERADESSEAAELEAVLAAAKARRQQQ